MRLLPLLAAALVAFAGHASAQIGHPGVTPPPYQDVTTVTGAASISSVAPWRLSGPCDILNAASDTCVAAYSATRRMIASYTGPLFQLERSSDSATLNVGTQSSGLVDTSGVAAFCLGTNCAFSVIYDQSGNGNDLTQATFANMAPWLTHYANGLPVVWTGGALSYYRNMSPTNLPTGALSKYVYEVRGMDYWSCCGDFGMAENPVATPNYSCSGQAACPNGSMFELDYSKWARWSGTTLLTLPAPGLGLDLEYFETNAAQTTPTVASVMAQYNSATNGLSMFWGDATKGPLHSIGQGPAPTTPVVQNSLRLGEGGDASRGAAEFFEGAVVSGSPSAATSAAVQASIAAFYGAQATPVQTASDALLNPASAMQNGANAYADPFLTDGGLWGFRRLREGYTGYAAQIRRASDNTTLNVGFDAAGNFDTAAAAQFCSGTTCYVATLYYQGLFQGTNGNDAGALDMVQATTADQPGLSFNALNGRTVATFNGTSQFLCTQSSALPSYSFGGMWAVAERTGNDTAYNTVLSSQQGFLGFNNAAGSAYYKTGNSGTILTPALADNTWASLIGYGNATAGNVTLYVNGTPTTNTQGTTQTPAAYICMGSGSTGGSLYLQGSIAEAGVVAGGNNQVAPAGQMTGTLATQLYNNQSAEFGHAF